MHRSRVLAAFALAALFAVPVSVQASLVISLANVTGPTAAAGNFEVLLTNTAGIGGPTFDVASFSYTLVLPAASGVHFTSAVTSTPSAPYIFAGTGGEAVGPGFSLSLDPFPNADLSASDTEFMSPSIAIKPGEVFGLGWIGCAVSPAAPGENVLIAFLASGTSLSDASGDAIPFTTDSRMGIITVNAVPEPGSLALAASALATLLINLGSSASPHVSPVANDVKMHERN